MSEALISLNNISYAYPGRSLLFDSLNLDLAPGPLGLIGANGSGKTTLFHLIMGLIRPQQGSIIFQGEKVVEEQQWQGLRRQVGYLFQDSDDQLFSPTVVEDVAFGPLNLGVSSEQALERSLNTLTGLGLDHLCQRVTHHLSGGEKKLVALATLLVMEPRMLLLDEPTNNLDGETRQVLVRILQNIELPFLIISHDFDFLSATTSTLYSLEKGQVSQAKTAHLHTHAHAHVHGDHPHEHSHD